MNIKAIVIPFVGAALLTSAALVGAQDNTDPAQPPAIEQQDGDRPGPRDRFQRGNALFDGELRALIEQYTGLTGRDLLQEVRNNEGSLADLIAANGGDVDAFISDAVELAEARVDEAVADGKIDVDRAEMLKANLPEIVTEIVSGEFEPRRQGGDGFRIAGEIEAVALIETYTGLEGPAVRDAIQGGSTLAELIAANGGDVDAFTTEAVALAEARIDEAVAAGRMEAERAEQIKANLTEIITARLNGERPERPVATN